MTGSIYDLSATALDGKPFELAALRGKVLLVVNTASRCGYTPQYQGLQKLHETYAERGLVILGFPCNQFGGQEPGNAEEIRSFCDLNYKIAFPMFAKVEVNGPGTHPVFAFLKSQAKGVLGTESIKWNFTKFLVARDGTVLERYAPTTQPSVIASDIEKALGA